MDHFWAIGHSLWVGRRTAEPGFVSYAQGGSSDVLTTTDSLPPVTEGHIRLVLISDTHEQHGTVTVPPCDLLLHCGDVLLINRHFSEEYSRGKIEEFGEWLRQQPAKEVLVIAGNHDLAFQTLGKEQVAALLGNGVRYLEDEAVQAAGLTVFGSPWSCGPTGTGNDAFQRRAFAPDASAENVDVLMTHGPVPSPQVKQLRPRLAIHGHIHDRYGLKRTQAEGIMEVNCSIFDGRFHPTHCPIVVDLPFR